MIQEYFESFSGRLSVVTLLFFFFRILRQSRTPSLRLTDQKNPSQADGGGEDQRAGNLGSFRVIVVFTVTSSNCNVKIARFYEFLFTLG